VVALGAELDEGTVFIEYGHVTGWEVEQLAGPERLLTTVRVADPDRTFEQVAPMRARTRVVREAPKCRREGRPCLDLGVGASHSLHRSRAYRDARVVHECGKVTTVLLHQNPPRLDGTLMEPALGSEWNPPHLCGGHWHDLH